MRTSLAVAFLSLLARPCFAQSNLEVPTCQWGDCSRYCEPACGVGAICGVDGKCVPIKTDEQRDQEAVSRRHQARALTRVTVGIGLGSGKVEGNIDSSLFELEGGIRHQLATYLGISAHLGAAYGEISVPYGAEPSIGSKERSSYVDFWADAIPYIGPLGRLYVGPALVLAHRRYADALVYRGSVPPLAVSSRTRFETGGRLGILVGNREQFNLWVQGTSSLNDTTLQQFLLGFNLEFM